MDIKELRKPIAITDVDFRVQSINNGGYATILAYKDARVDMNRLDDVCLGLWQKDYKIIEGKLFCGVGIKIDNEWVWKWDVGTESFTEKQKGQASDAFKRACFNWGIGRELYNYPVISVKMLPHEAKQEGGKYKQTFGLKLKEWNWQAKFSENNIIELIAYDDNRKERFKWKDTDNVITFKQYEEYKPEPEKKREDLTYEQAAALINSSNTLKELQDNFFKLKPEMQKAIVNLKNELKTKLENVSQ